MSITPPEHIDRFDGPFRFLSNFYVSPVEFIGVVYPTSEHAFQAAKAVDLQAHDFVLAARGPAEAKRRGRVIQCRADWDEVRNDVMLEVLRAKFATEPNRQMLLATGNSKLTEGNWWHDQEWGDCTCPKHAGVQGANMLGKLLMQVREELRGGGTDQSAE